MRRLASFALAFCASAAGADLSMRSELGGAAIASDLPGRSTTTLGYMAGQARAGEWSAYAVLGQRPDGNFAPVIAAVSAEPLSWLQITAGRPAVAFGSEVLSYSFYIPPPSQPVTSSDVVRAARAALFAPDVGASVAAHAGGWSLAYSYYRQRTGVVQSGGDVQFVPRESVPTDLKPTAAIVRPVVGNLLDPVFALLGATVGLPMPPQSPQITAARVTVSGHHLAAEWLTHDGRAYADALYVTAPGVPGRTIGCVGGDYWIGQARVGLEVSYLGDLMRAGTLSGLYQFDDLTAFGYAAALVPGYEAGVGALRSWGPFNLRSTVRRADLSLLGARAGGWSGEIAASFSFSGGK